VAVVMEAAMVVILEAATPVVAVTPAVEATPVAAVAMPAARWRGHLRLLPHRPVACHRRLPVVSRGGAGCGAYIPFDKAAF
jgi:hypothetical protein